MVPAFTYELAIERPGEIPSSAPRGRVAQEWEWDRYPNHPGYGAKPRDVLNIFRLAETGFWLSQCDLVDDLVESDGTLRNLFEQREGATAGQPWSLQADGADGDSQLAAEVLAEALSPLPMADVFTHQISGANRYGAGAGEIDWATRVYGARQFVVPEWFADVPARRFRIDTLTNTLRLLTEGSLTEGVDLAPGKWWITKLPGPIARAGLMRTAAWLALYKRYGTRDWVIYAERFGLPNLLIEIDENASPAAKAVARRAAQSFGSDGSGLLEKPATGGPLTVHLNQAAAADASSTHGSLITYCNREMAKLINGSTLSNSSEDSGGASYALGNVHASVRWETVLRDVARLKESFRRCVAIPFMVFNGLTGRPPKLEIQVVRDLEPADLLAAAEVLVKLGMKVSGSQLRSITGLHAPIGDGDEVGSGAPTAGSLGANLENAAKALKLLKAGVSPDLIGQALGVPVTVLDACVDLVKGAA